MEKVISMDIFSEAGSPEVQYVISEFASEYDHYFIFQEFEFQANYNLAFRRGIDCDSLLDAQELFDQTRQKYADMGRKITFKDWGYDHKWPFFLK